MVKRRPALDVESRNDAPGGPDGVNQRDLGDLIDAGAVRGLGARDHHVRFQQHALERDPLAVEFVEDRL